MTHEDGLNHQNERDKRETKKEHRRRLREDPEIIPRAAEEYLRRFALTNTAREIRQDVERKGVTMKAGPPRPAGIRR